MLGKGKPNPLLIGLILVQLLYDCYTKLKLYIHYVVQTVRALSLPSQPTMEVSRSSGKHASSMTLAFKATARSLFSLCPNQAGNVKVFITPQTNSKQRGTGNGGWIAQLYYLLIGQFWGKLNSLLKVPRRIVFQWPVAVTTLQYTTTDPFFPSLIPLLPSCASWNNNSNEFMHPNPHLKIWISWNSN